MRKTLVMLAVMSRRRPRPPGAAAEHHDPFALGDHRLLHHLDDFQMLAHQAEEPAVGVEALMHAAPGQQAGRTVIAHADPGRQQTLQRGEVAGLQRGIIGIENRLAQSGLPYKTSPAFTPCAASRKHGCGRPGHVMTIRILHLITGLDTGGAERMLEKLVTGMDHGRFRNVVVSLKDEGVIGPRLRQAGIAVHALGMRGGIALPGRMLALARLIANMQPDILQTWLYHADLAGTLAHAFSGSSSLLAWNLRCSDMHLADS